MKERVVSESFFREQMDGENLLMKEMNMGLELDIQIEYPGRTPLKQMSVSIEYVEEDKGGNACKTSFH